jgi:hypothetical protein
MTSPLLTRMANHNSALGATDGPHPLASGFLSAP